MIRFVPREDLFHAGAVARAFVLQDATLVHLEARRSIPSFEALKDEPETKVQDTARASFLDDGKRLQVTVQFIVTASVSKSGSSTEAVSVAGTFELEYLRAVDDAKTTDDYAQTFARTNGVYNAWPYIREIVSNTFVRLGYPALTLESLVFSPKPDEPAVKASGSTGTNRIAQNGA